MNNRLLRTLIIVVQSLCFVLCLGFAIYGLVATPEEGSTMAYSTCAIRLSTVFLLTLAYYRNNVSANNPGNLFTIIFLFFMTVSELQVLTNISHLTGWGLIPPRVCVRVTMLSYFMIFFSILGFALFEQNNEHQTSRGFMFLGFSSLLFLASTIPASQDVFGIWQMRVPFICLTILFALAVISHIILIASEPQKAWVLRQLATIVLITGSYMTAISTNGICIMVSTILYAVSALTLTVLMLRNSIIL